MSPPKIKIEFNQHFLGELKKFIKNNPKRLDEYKKAVSLFICTPHHPSLNIEKLKILKILIQ
jgi:hypothetical protein